MRFYTASVDSGRSVAGNLSGHVTAGDWLSFQATVQVRNKLVSAYHDITNMQVCGLTAVL
jgi:hypothetical protein